MQAIPVVELAEADLEKAQNESSSVSCRKLPCIEN